MYNIGPMMNTVVFVYLKISCRLCVSVLITKGKNNQNRGSGRKLLEVVGVFMAVIVVMVSWMHTYLQTH